MKKKRAKRSVVWSYKVGELTAYERKDRGHAIWTRTGPNAAGKYENIRPLCAPIRNEAGKIDTTLETRARAAADARWAEMQSGADPLVDPKAPLTLRAGIRLVCDPKSGKYVGKKAWNDEVVRYLTDICAIPFTNAHNSAVKTLGDVALDEVRHAHYRRAWRWMAEQHIENPDRWGVRASEIACGALRSAMAWLAQEEIIDAGTGLPAPGWKAQMETDWVDMTGRPIAETKKLRYTKDESGRIWKALPKADPRIQLPTEIGAELRLGQVVHRTRRSDVEAYGDHPIGMVTIHGAGKKKGAKVILTDQQIAVLTDAMTTGFLSELEKAYQAGEVDDYMLIAGGHLKGGKAQVHNAMKSLDPRVMRKLWQKLEEAAGVTYVKFRGWYGMRRRAADDAEDVETDARVLNQMGGWTNTETRVGYQQAGRLDIAERAADVRKKIRPANAPKSVDLQPLNSTTHLA